MARIFISHSSKDKDFVRRLVSDLADLGHMPWLDEWQIKVGECIVTKIEHGVEEADYVIIVLSQNSVKSGWVEREWKSKYWEEIEKDKTLILPVLIEDCEIPQLLKTKRYADFRRNYSTALVELMSAISPIIRKQSLPEEINISPVSSEISGLIAKIQSKSTLLSQCIAEALSVAQKINDSSLYSFCVNEIKGWDKEELRQYTQKRPGYRLFEVFASFTHQVNMQHFGWGNNPSAVLNYLRRDTENFIPVTMLFPHPVLEVENKAAFDPTNSILQISLTVKQLLPESEHPDAPLQAYCSADTFTQMLDSIRHELTSQLVDLLPKAEAT